MPHIHTGTPTHSCSDRGGTEPSGGGLSSCSKTLQHTTRRSQGSNQEPCHNTGTLPSTHVHHLKLFLSLTDILLVCTFPSSLPTSYPAPTSCCNRKHRKSIIKAIQGVFIAELINVMAIYGNPPLKVFKMSCFEEVWGFNMIIILILGSQWGVLVSHDGQNQEFADFFMLSRSSMTLQTTIQSDYNPANPDMKTSFGLCFTDKSIQSSHIKT